MRVLTASFINELEKLINKKKYIVFLVIGILICVGNVGVSLFTSKLSRGMITLKITNLSMSMLGFFIEILIPLIIFMAATDLFCSEEQEQTLKAILMRPISRFKIFISKIFAVLAVSAINLAFIFITTTVLEIMFKGTDKLTSNIITSFSAYAINIIPLLIVVLMAALMNQLVKSPTLAMLLCVILYFGLKLSYLYMPTLSMMVFTSYMQWHRLWLGSSLPLTSMIGKISILVSYAVIFLSGGYYLFEKKEV